MIKKLLLVVGALIAGTLIGLQFAGVSISDVTSAVTSRMQPLINRVQTVWLSMPESTRGIMMLGIPTAFAMFFAWTKTRAMQKLQQTQQQAAERFNQMQGEAFEQQKGFTQQIGTYHTQLGAQQQKIQTLQNQLSNATPQDAYQKLLHNYERLQIEYNTMENTLHNEISKLKQEKQIVVK